MSQVTYFPTNETISKDPPYLVCRVWSYSSIEIERTVGTCRRPNGHVDRATRTIRYEGVTEASKKRLHRAIGKLINKGQATIDFIHGDLGLGYEVEL